MELRASLFLSIILVYSIFVSSKVSCMHSGRIGRGSPPEEIYPSTYRRANVNLNVNRNANDGMISYRRSFTSTNDENGRGYDGENRNVNVNVNVNSNRNF